MKVACNRCTKQHLIINFDAKHREASKCGSSTAVCAGLHLHRDGALAERAIDGGTRRARASGDTCTAGWRPGARCSMDSKGSVRFWPVGGLSCSIIEVGVSCNWCRKIDPERAPR